MTTDVNVQSAGSKVGNKDSTNPGDSKVDRIMSPLSMLAHRAAIESCCWAVGTVKLEKV